MVRARLASAANAPKLKIGSLIAAVCTLTAPLSEELRHAVEIDDASRASSLLAGASSLLRLFPRARRRLLTRVSSVSAGAFHQLTGLRVLQLYNNDLTALPTGVFDKLGALTDLGLAFNAIESLPAGLFQQLMT